MVQKFPDLGIGLLYGTEYEWLVRDADRICQVPTNRRGAIYSYEGKYGAYLSKTTHHRWVECLTA